MKNTQQLHTLFALSNLWMMRGRLMAEAIAWAQTPPARAGNRRLLYAERRAAFEPGAAPLAPHRLYVDGVLLQNEF